MKVVGPGIIKFVFKLGGDITFLSFQNHNRVIVENYGDDDDEWWLDDTTLWYDYSNREEKDNTFSSIYIYSNLYFFIRILCFEWC